MSGGREGTLAAIRKSLGRGRLAADTIAELDRRLASPQSNVVPARGHLDADARTKLFIAEAERVNATVARVEGLAAVPSAAADYLRQASLPLNARIGTDPMLSAVEWSSEPALTVEAGKAVDSDTASITTATAGVAETGTLVLVSSPQTPTTLNFLPVAHIVLLPVGRIFGAYEEAWAQLRRDYVEGNMPRVVNWITGPSRTADIEQTLLLGAHGPRRLHILICDGHES